MRRSLSAPTQQEADDPDTGDGSPPPTKDVEIPGPPVVLAKQDSGSNNGSDAPASQHAEGLEEGGGGAEEPSTPLLQEEGRNDSAAGPAVPAVPAAPAAAQRESGEEERGVGLAGDTATIESIQNLLLMVPVDLEKLRNLAWEKGGYQVCCLVRESDKLFRVLSSVYVVW